MQRIQRRTGRRLILRRTRIFHQHIPSPHPLRHCCEHLHWKSRPRPRRNHPSRRLPVRHRDGHQPPRHPILLKLRDRLKQTKIHTAPRPTLHPVVKPFNLRQRALINASRDAQDRWQRHGRSRGNLRSRLKRGELSCRRWLNALVSRGSAIRVAQRARIQDARVLNQLRRGFLS